MKASSSNSVIGGISSGVKPVRIVNNNDVFGITTTLIFDGSDRSLLASGTIRRPTNPNEHGITSGFYNRFRTAQDWAAAHGRFCI